MCKIKPVRAIPFQIGVVLKMISQRIKDILEQNVFFSLTKIKTKSCGELIFSYLI